MLRETIGLDLVKEHVRELAADVIGRAHTGETMHPRIFFISGRDGSGKLMAAKLLATTHKTLLMCKCVQTLSGQDPWNGTNRHKGPFLLKPSTILPIGAKILQNSGQEGRVKRGPKVGRDAQIMYEVECASGGMQEVNEEDLELVDMYGNGDEKEVKTPSVYILDTKKYPPPANAAEILLRLARRGSIVMLLHRDAQGSKADIRTAQKSILDKLNELRDHDRLREVKLPSMDAKRLAERFSQSSCNA